MRVLNKLLAAFFSAVLVLGLSPVTAFATLAQETDGSSMWTRVILSHKGQNVDSHATGALAPQTPIFSVHDQNYDGLQAQANIPSSYSSKDKGRVTPVTDQNPFGTCWAFSTIAAAESSILTKGLATSVDLSERHLAYFTYHPQVDPLGGTAGDGTKALSSGFTGEFSDTNDVYLGAGANGEMTMHVLSSWIGAADESAASYEKLIDAYPGNGSTIATLNKFLSDTALPSSLAYEDSYHLQNGYMISLQDKGDVKQAIMNHGAVAINLNADEAPYYNDTYGTFYNPDNSDTNHMVVAVGWDDDFSAEKFGQEYGWSQDALSAPLLVDGGSSLSFDSQDTAWLRFAPSASGFYDFSYIPNGHLGITAYELDEKTKSPVRVFSSSDSIFMNCFFEGGKTYYVKAVRGSGDTMQFSMELKRAASTVTIPASASELKEGQKASLANPDDTGWCWFTFTPAKSGLYSAALESGDLLNAYILCANDYDGGLLSRGQIASSRPDGGAVQLQAGQTYYVRCYLSAGTSGTISIGFDRDSKLVSSDPSSPKVDCTPIRPAQNGAWLCKNSWGTYWGNDGYFWLSYENACLNTDIARAISYDMAPATNYDNNYQYDGSSAPYYNILPSGGSIANVYTAHANAGGGEELKAVGLSLYNVNVDYSIQVYVNPTNDTNPTSGSPALAQPATGRLTYEGFHTIDLPQSVTLSEGEKFAVVITLSHADGSPVFYGVDTTVDQGFVEFTNQCAKGQSLSLYPGAKEWYDLSGERQSPNDESGATARIKAFTKNVAAMPTELPIANADVKVTGVVDVAGEKKPTVTVSYGGVLLAQDKQYSMSSKYDATTGLITISVTGLGDYTGTKTITHQSTPASKPGGQETKPGQTPSVVTPQPGNEQKPGNSSPPADSAPVTSQPMYRLYNPNSGEHFYTASAAERDSVVAAGWDYEGVGWNAPTAGTPVFRLYNAVGGEHHYTAKADERDALVAAGWTWEDGGWFSAPNGSVPLFRAYNPNAFANNHNYTADANEHQTLLALGWKDEGIGWQGVK